MCSPFNIETIVIETPRGSFVKRNEHGAVDFISPIPSPFNYGHIKGKMGGDGDPLDGLLLGKRRKRGEVINAKIVGCVCFVDANQQDDKWILSEKAVTKKEKIVLLGFFRIYAQLKILVSIAKGEKKSSYIRAIEYY